MYISLKLENNFSSYCYSVTLLIFPSHSLEGLSHYIYLLSGNLGPPFVDRPGHHLSACPIKHIPKPLLSCGSQNSTVQRSSPHKCSQEIWQNALNVGAATILLVMSGLTLSSKLFLNNRTSPGNVPLTRPYRPRGQSPRNGMPSSTLGLTRGNTTLSNFCTPQYISSIKSYNLISTLGAQYFFYQQPDSY